MKEKLKNNPVFIFFYRLLKVITYRIIFSTPIYKLFYPHNINDVIELGKKYTLLICHNNGGGTYTYLKNKYENQKDTIILRNIKTADIDYLYSIENNETHNFFYFHPKQIYSISNNIKDIKILVVESYMSIAILFEWMKTLNISISYDLHDFHCIWKDAHLCNSKGYMSENEIRNAYMNYLTRKITFEYWHNLWNNFFTYVNKVFAFSNSSKELFNHYFPDFKDKVIVIPHSIDYIKYTEIEKIPAKFKIGIFGSIQDVDKGCLVLKDFLRFSVSQDYEVYINGTLRADCCIYSKNIHYMGPYKSDSIKDLIIKQEISVVLFPSVWPETFSYLVSELIAAGIPLACFNMGAQGEKVSKYKYGQIISDFSPESILNALQSAHQKSLIKA